jgi:UDP-N-acetylmuramate dehydrogenase
VEEVRFFDRDKMDFKSCVNNECNFGYRNSIFRHQSDKIITSVILSQHYGDTETILSNLKDLIQKKVTTQPRSYPSAGCIFKNPEGQSAGALIDQIGLKGRRIGNAQISEKHANFIVNLGGAKSEEIVALIELIKSCIQREFGLNLVEEIIYLSK